MPLSLDPGNVIQFFTFLSPILISSFFVLQSFMDADIKALVWLFGQILAWGIGMGAKFGFHSIDNGKVAANGNHMDLLKSSPIYKNFYEKQIRRD